MLAIETPPLLVVNHIEARGPGERSNLPFLEQMAGSTWSVAGDSSPAGDVGQETRIR